MSFAFGLFPIPCHVITHLPRQRLLQGYYRRGSAYMGMGKFKDALKDFKQVGRVEGVKQEGRNHHMLVGVQACELTSLLMG